VRQRALACTRHASLDVILSILSIMSLA
jgi:hypothetical protein